MKENWCELFGLLINSKEALNIINHVSHTKHFDSCDFATLYTNILHEGLKMNIRNLVREAFKVRG